MRDKCKKLSSVKQPPQPKAQSDWRPNEWYETLLRLKADQPRRYQCSISTGTQRCVDIYAEQKALATQKAA
jgi:hypothetical protein